LKLDFFNFFNLKLVSIFENDLPFVRLVSDLNNCARYERGWCKARMAYKKPRSYSWFLTVGQARGQEGLR